MNCRDFLAACVAAGFTLGAASLRAQAQGVGAFRTKPGKVIVGFAPGGATD